LSVFIEFLVVEQLASQAPYQPKKRQSLRSEQTLVEFILSVIAGASVLPTSISYERIALYTRFWACDDSIWDYFRRFSQAEVERFWRPMWRWLISRLPLLFYIVGCAVEMPEPIKGGATARCSNFSTVPGSASLG
jgi:hypothetical protein